jgi:hypothetical protein
LTGAFTDEILLCSVRWLQTDVLSATFAEDILARLLTTEW